MGRHELLNPRDGAEMIAYLKTATRNFSQLVMAVCWTNSHVRYWHIADNPTALALLSE
jgi:hypothetical protein